MSFGVPEDHPARQILLITILYRSALYSATVPTSAIQKALRCRENQTPKVSRRSLPRWFQNWRQQCEAHRHLYRSSLSFVRSLGDLLFDVGKSDGRTISKKEVTTVRIFNTRCISRCGNLFSAAVLTCFFAGPSCLVFRIFIAFGQSHNETE